MVAQGPICGLPKVPSGQSVSPALHWGACCTQCPPRRGDQRKTQQPKSPQGQRPSTRMAPLSHLQQQGGGPWFAVPRPLTPQESTSSTRRPPFKTERRRDVPSCLQLAHTHDPPIPEHCARAGHGHRPQGNTTPNCFPAVHHPAGAQVAVQRPSEAVGVSRDAA